MIEFSFFWKHAGFVSIWVGEYVAFHLFPSRSHWEYGYHSYWYDGPYHTLGFGPLCVICW